MNRPIVNTPVTLDSPEGGLSVYAAIATADPIAFIANGARGIVKRWLSEDFAGVIWDGWPEQSTPAAWLKAA